METQKSAAHVQVSIKAAHDSSNFAHAAVRNMRGVHSVERVFPHESDEELKCYFVAKVPQDMLDQVLAALRGSRFIETVEVCQPRKATEEPARSETTSDESARRDLPGHSPKPEAPAPAPVEAPKTNTDKERGIKTFYNVKTLFKASMLEWEVALLPNFFVDSRGVYRSGAAEKIGTIRSRVLLTESSALDVMRILMRTNVTFKVESVHAEDGLPYKFALLSDEDSKRLKEVVDAQDE